MRPHEMRLSLALALVATLVIACGGDSGTGPTVQPPPAQPPTLPAGTVTKVPRILRLTSIDSNTVPVVNYRSADGVHAIRTDSATATLQSDSGIVLRIFGVYGERAVPSDYWTAMSFTLGGRLQSTGLATAAADGYGAKIHVLADGAIVADVTIVDGNAGHSFGTLTFATAYDGPLNPAPVISSITPPGVLQNAVSVRLVISGSGFVPTTRVTWNKTIPLETTYESANRITALVPGSYLQTVGYVAVTLSNPEPAGGQVSTEYVILTRPPTLLSLSPATLPVNGGYNTLQLHGKDFTQATTVLWNGVPRSSFTTSSTDITMQLADSDLATAQTVQVSLRTPRQVDTLGGGTSAALPFAIVGPAAQKLAEVVVPFAASQLLADPVRSLVYAMPSAHETARSNTILALDPATGQTAWSLDVGAPVTNAAIPDDGQFLYIGRANDSTIVRIALGTHVIDRTIQLGGVPAIGPYTAVALAVAPGSPRTVAVVSSGVGVMIFDDTVRRATPGNGIPFLTTLAFTNAQSLMGVSTDGIVATLAVGASGAATADPHAAVVGAGDHVVSGSRVYSSAGIVYDGSTHAMTTLGAFVGSVGVVSSSDGALLYTADARGQNLRAYDIARNLEAGAVRLGGNAQQGGSGSMVRFGSDGLAFTTYASIYFVRASFVR